MKQIDQKRRHVRQKPPDSPQDPLAPFERLPTTLESSTTLLTNSNVYVIHVDQRPSSFKRKIFLVPAIMHALGFLLLVWRAMHATPYYMSILGALVTPSPGLQQHTVDEFGWKDSLWEIISRAAVFSFDLVLFSYVAGSVLEFVAGRTHGNPVSWRWHVGFRDQEIYVRRSRQWTTTQSGEPSAGFAVLSTSEVNAKLSQAMSPGLIAEKTGYILMNVDWELDFDAMIGLTRQVDQGIIGLDDLKLVALVMDKRYGWLTSNQAPSPASLTIDDHRLRQMETLKRILAAENQ